MIQELVNIMQDKHFRKTVGQRIKALRKQNNWSQKELAEKLHIRFGQINKYECGLNTPPLEKLLEISEVLNVTVDYLLTGDNSEVTPIHNTRLLERFKLLQKSQNDDQEAVIKLIDAMIFKQKVESAVVKID